MRPRPLAEMTFPAAVTHLPAPPRRGLAVAVACAAVCGALGLLVAPVLLGPAAVAGGFAGEHAGRGDTRTPGAIAVVIALAGALTAVLLTR